MFPACERRHLDTVKKILQQTKVNINHVNRLGLTALLDVMTLGDGLSFNPIPLIVGVVIIILIIQNRKFLLDKNPRKNSDKSP